MCVCLLLPTFTTEIRTITSDHALVRQQRRHHHGPLPSRQAHPTPHRHAPPSSTFTPTPDMVANFMTKQTQRITHERHCRRVFGAGCPHPSRTHCARATNSSLTSALNESFPYPLALACSGSYFLRHVHSRCDACTPNFQVILF